MKKYWTKFISMGMALVLLVMPFSPIKAEEKKVVNPETYYIEKAKHIVDSQIDDGSFVIRDDSKAMEMFNIKNMVVPSIESGIERNGNAINSEEESIKRVVYEYNMCSLSSLFSGVYQIHPKSNFGSDAIYQEANARNLYEIFNKQGAGENVSSYNFFIEYKQLIIGQEFAKVVIERHADVVYSDSVDKNRSFGGQEGYLLKKIGNKWVIENIIFATDFISPLFDAFLKCNQESEWISDYMFECCQRKQYESDLNFYDYIDGSIEAPKLKIELMHLSYGPISNTTVDAELYAKGYSKANCAAYAERYGFNPNLNYVYFNAFEGGDCTNFVSQCIYAGGLQMTSGWYHKNKSSYSTSWIRVIELRDYLINSNLAKGYYQKMPNYPSGVGISGTPIQFSNGSTWHHSAIVLGRDNRGYYVAEHTGKHGNVSYQSIGNSLSNKRTFWVASGRSM